MPFSFIEIEQKKTRVIGLLFVFIIFCYFLTAYCLLLVLENAFLMETGKTDFQWPSFDHALMALGFAFIVAALHWSMSTSNLIEKISLATGAIPLDSKDTYHQYFKNIVDEVSIAIGGRPLEARVIPTVSMNAFALEDFQGRAVIGITEGLLAKLNRAQIEAVVGHEAGHIASGDCLSTTVTCALAELYESTLNKLTAGLRETRGRGGVVLVFVFLVIGFMNLMSSLLRSFISRQREFRADAIAVRLTRDPLSLAEALKLITKGWRGEGSEGDKLQSIFIVNPTPSELDESQGLFSDLFSTHPPVKTRIDILLSMAHLDEKALEDNLKNFKRVSPVANVEVSADEPNEVKQWFVFMDQKWAGPYLPQEIAKLENLKPDQWIKPADTTGDQKVRCLYEEKNLLSLFSKAEEELPSMNCPHCKTSLSEVLYEGTPILKCTYCHGAFVENDKISRILIRPDQQFSEETIRLAETIIKHNDKFIPKLRKVDLREEGNSQWVLDCPKDGRKMRRQFFVYSYPVEIDRCIYCDGVWFDKDELEILQYIYEHKEEFFDGKGF